jgi:hypothetical protein
MADVTPPQNSWFNKILKAALGGLVPDDWFTAKVTAAGIPEGTPHAPIANLALTGTYATDDPNIQAAVNGILATLRSYGMVNP